MRTALIAALALALACDGGPGEPSGTPLPVGTGLLVLTDAAGTVDTVPLDTAYVDGPQPVPWNGGTYEVDAVYFVQYDFNLVVGLRGDEFSAMPGSTTYPIGVTGPRVVYAGLRWNGDDFLADSGSVRVRKLGGGRTEWTVTVRLLDPNNPPPTYLRLVATMVAERPDTTSVP